MQVPGQRNNAKASREAVLGVTKRLPPLRGSSLSQFLTWDWHLRLLHIAASRLDWSMRHMRMIPVVTHRGDSHRTFQRASGGQAAKPFGWDVQIGKLRGLLARGM